MGRRMGRWVETAAWRGEVSVPGLILSSMAVDTSAEKGRVVAT